MLGDRESHLQFLDGLTLASDTLVSTWHSWKLVPSKKPIPEPSSAGGKVCGLFFLVVGGRVLLGTIPCALF